MPRILKLGKHRNSSYMLRKKYNLKLNIFCLLVQMSTGDILSSGSLVKRSSSYYYYVRIRTNVKQEE